MSNRMDNVELLKKEKFGVEIEYSLLSRSHVAKLICKYYGIDPGTICHSHQGLDTYSFIDPKGRKWKVVSDSSVNGSGGDNGGELVTPPLNYEDIEDLQKIVRLMREDGAKSGPRYCCGIHIHVDSNIGEIGGHTPRSLRTLTNLVVGHADLLFNAVGVDRDSNRFGYCGYENRNFVSVLNSIRPRSMDQFKKIWYGTYRYGDDWSRISTSSVDSMSDEHYNSSRYQMLNFHALWQHNTIEFRLFQFNNNIHAGELKSFIQLCLAMNSYSKLISHASPIQSTCQNQKFLMKNWLMNMGLSGDEFKTCRKMLTKRLRGDTAYRNGRVVRNETDLDDNFIDRMVMEG